MLTLHKFSAEDYPLYTEVVFNESVMHMNLGRVFTNEEATQFFRMILAVNSQNEHLGFFKVLLDNNGTPLYAGMSAAVWSSEYHAIELEYMLLPAHWHQGWGTALVQLLIRHTFIHFPGTDLIAIADPSNLYSKQILFKTGFHMEQAFINPDGDPAELYRCTPAGRPPTDRRVNS